MSTLDIVLVLVLIAYAISGYWQGFITGAFATAGLLIGGGLGILLAPHLLGKASPSVWVSVGALFVVLVCASIGQAVFQFAGSRVRDLIRWRPARALDAVGGALLSCCAVLLVTWAIGVAATGASMPWLAKAVNESVVLRAVDQVMPARAATALHAFDDVVGTSVFPRYLEPFAPERIVAVEAPPASIAGNANVAAAERSVFKVRGDNVCGRGVEGSAFVYAPERLLTNAHVVAGVRKPGVLVGSKVMTARVVEYDPGLDIAVLEVPGLQAPALELDTGGKADQPGAVLGYPQDGPYDVEPARIRSEQRLRSPDIYGQGTVIREVFSLRALVRPGNSGGPLVSTSGKVLGVVFAASVSDNETGYALTTEQIAKIAEAGATATTAVSTGSCA